jgi:hypothetical protein
LECDEQVYEAVVHNGDDNVAGRGKTIGGVLARPITKLLDGKVFPLGGNCGRYVWEVDRC